VTAPRSPAGRFITLEGPDGSGKTLHAKRLADALRARAHDVVLTREPGGTPLGERIRALLLTRGEAPLGPRTDALLFNAARAQHVWEVIDPSLAAGRIVVCARYADSTLAYQGYGSGVPIDELRTLIRIATGGRTPDRTILLDLPVEAGLRRKSPDDTETRFETAFDLDFHHRVRAGFLAMAAAEPARWAVVDADRDADAVFADVLAAALPVVEAGLTEPGAVQPA
jgi:dTMP kinase